MWHSQINRSPNSAFCWELNLAFLLIQPWFSIVFCSLKLLQCSSYNWSFSNPSNLVLMIEFLHCVYVCNEKEKIFAAVKNFWWDFSFLWLMRTLKDRIVDTLWMINSSLWYGLEEGGVIWWLKWQHRCINYTKIHEDRIMSVMYGYRLKVQEIQIRKLFQYSHKTQLDSTSPDKYVRSCLRQQAPSSNVHHAQH